MPVKRAKRSRITNDQLIAAIKVTGANPSLIALQLAIPRAAVISRIIISPALRQAAQEALEGLKDHARANIVAQIKGGNADYGARHLKELELDWLPEMPCEKPKEPKRRLGAPSMYTPELAIEICNRMAQGMSLREICRDPKMPEKATIFMWVASKRDFADQYAQAMQARMMCVGEELLDITDDGANDWMKRNGIKSADNEHIQRSRLRVDTRKWLLSKLVPKVYGDKPPLPLGADEDGASDIKVIVSGGLPVADDPN